MKLTARVRNQVSEVRIFGLRGDRLLEWVEVLCSGFVGWRVGLVFKGICKMLRGLNWMLRLWLFGVPGGGSRVDWERRVRRRYRSCLRCPLMEGGFNGGVGGSWNEVLGRREGRELGSVVGAKCGACGCYCAYLSVGVRPGEEGSGCGYYGEGWGVEDEER